MRSFAIASGKGGVGKTVIAANLAIWLALEGHRVLIFDADLGLANIDIALGLEPQVTLKHVVRGRPMSEALIEGPAGIHLIPGGSGVEDLVTLGSSRLRGLLDELQTMAESYDFLIFDAAAGIHPGVMACIAAADEACVVCTPEPSSMIDAYACIKSLAALKPEAQVSVVVNMSDNPRHGVLVFERLKMITGQYLSIELKFAGSVRRDEAMIACARQRQPILLAHPVAAASRDLEDAASQLFFRRPIQRKELSLFEKLKQSLGQQKAA
jgi:flagellar biosynthesis protein FlhG